MARGINKVVIEVCQLDVTQEQIDVFWSKVNIKNRPTDCWEWLGAKKPKGYGNIRINNNYLLAHRVAFELANGLIPPGYIVCHICDNPSCCNPSHLMLGTTKSNAVDMLMKNRQKKFSPSTSGEKNINSKLSNSDVIAIRNKYRNRELNQYQLAEIYGVSQSAIGSIVRNETWRHLNA